MSYANAFTALNAFNIGIVNEFDVDIAILADKFRESSVFSN